MNLQKVDKTTLLELPGTSIEYYNPTNNKLIAYNIMHSNRITTYDYLVNEHTLTLLAALTEEFRNEELALQLTVSAFEKLWYYIQTNDAPSNPLEWLQIEAKKLNLDNLRPSKISRQ